MFDGTRSRCVLFSTHCCCVILVGWWRLFRLWMELCLNVIDGRTDRHILRQVCFVVFLTGRGGAVMRLIMYVMIVVVVVVVIAVKQPGLRSVAHQDERDFDCHVATNAAHDKPHFDVVRDVDGEEMALVRRTLERRGCQRGRQPSDVQNKKAVSLEKCQMFSSIGAVFPCASAVYLLCTVR